MKILVVEDTEDSRILLVDQLEFEGFEVDSAIHGLDALAKIETSSPDLIVSDILMPEMDGFELCQQLKKNPKYRKIPLIFYTATYTEPSDIKLALSMGAARFVLKPEDPVKLLKIINEVIIENKKQKSVISKKKLLEKSDFNAEHVKAVSKKLNKKLIELEEQKEQLQIITDAIPELIAEIDASGCYIYINKAYENWFKTSRDQVRGKKIETIVGSENYNTMNAYIERVHKGEKLIYEGLIRNGNKENRQVRINFIPHKQKESQKNGFFSFIYDLTEEKAAEEEKEKLIAQLRFSQKMEATGQMAGGIAHDFNNLLSIILGNLSVLKGRLAIDDPSHKQLESINKASHRAATLTKQLLNFSRTKAEQQSLIDVNQVIEGIKNLISRSLTPAIIVEHQYAEKLWLTTINSGELEDSLINLSINARDAMTGKGRLIFETRNTILDANYCHRNHGVIPGEYIELAVSDNGLGISPEQQEHIFEPFYTTKEQGMGTGLGLSMVFAFVKRSGGHIRCYSELGVGTTFRLYLPRIEEKIKDHSNNERPIETELINQLPRGNETILIVDDEADLVDLCKTFLDTLGYQIRTAFNAEQALAQLAEDPSINLLFSDVLMPGGMNGYELAQQGVASHSQLRVLLTSGFTGKVFDKNQRDFTFNTDLLCKPYTQAELALRIRRALDSEDHQ